MTEALVVGEAAVTVFGAFVAEAWPVAVVLGALVLGQAAVLRAAARAGRMWLAWQASRRAPIPGELWKGPTLGVVRVLRYDGGDPMLWLLSFGGASEVVFQPASVGSPGAPMTGDAQRTSVRLWRAAGMTPISRDEWDDYLKHGKVM